jgi:hypothetical protein
MSTMELHADADRLEHCYRPADAMSRAVRGFPIPHYADSPDAKTCTTAISEVT